MKKPNGEYNTAKFRESLPRARMALALWGEGNTLAEVGKIMGISKERARQLVQKARSHAK